MEKRDEILAEPLPRHEWTLYSLQVHITKLLELQRDEFLVLFATQKDVFRSLMDEAEKRNSQRFDAQQQGVATAMAANEKAVNAAMAAAEKLSTQMQISMDKAISKAEAAQYDKNVSMNEIRKMAEDQQNKFAQTSVVNLQVEGLRQELESMRAQVQQSTQRGLGQKEVVGWVVAGLSLVIAGLAVFWRH